MNTKIPPQNTPAPIGQNIGELVNKIRKDQLKNTTEPLAAKPRKLDSSYELQLSENAQSNLNSVLPTVRSPQDVRKQMDLIKAAAENAAGSILSAHKPSAKSVVDLLA